LLRAYAPPAAASHLAGVDRSEPIQVEGRCYVERSALARAAGTSTVGVAEFAGRRGVERPLGAARLIPLRFAICYVMLQGARPPVRWLEVEGESLTEIASDLFLQTELELEAAERESRSARVLFDANQRRNDEQAERFNRSQGDTIETPNGLRKNTQESVVLEHY